MLCAQALKAHGAKHASNPDSRISTQIKFNLSFMVAFQVSFGLDLIWCAVPCKLYGVECIDLASLAHRFRWGYKTYEEYVDAYVATVKPDILCFDLYPQFGDGGWGVSGKQGHGN